MVGKRFTFEEVLERSRVEGKGEYELLSSSYTNEKTKLLWKHLKCQKTFEMSTDGFFNRKNRCPHCYGDHKRTTEEFKNEVKKQVGNEYEVLGEYKTTHTPIKMLHKKCSKEFEMRPNNFLVKKNRCPHCATILLKNNRIMRACHSKSEDLIEEWLIKNNLKFQREVKFKETGRLRFDFKVILDNKFILIEFDGRFHKKPKDTASEITKKKYESQIKNDNRKNKFCQKNNIKLLRINNTKLIESSLQKEFNDYLSGNEELQ